ncbi:MAG: hypothetical protein ACRERE_34085 [Candidatus Entotheonellia bacterium]
MDQDEIPRDRLDLKDDRKFISPPILATPLYQCATAVTVLGFIPHAHIDIEVDGMVVVSEMAGFPEPNGQSFALPKQLVEDQVVRARQSYGGATSDWTQPVTVRDHTADYPAGPPRPQISPAPVHECGARTGVRNLLIGCEVWITADGTEVGRVKGAKEHQGINVTPDYGLGQTVIAWASMCSDPSPPSEQQITQPPPSPMPTPTIEPAYEGSEQIAINGLANGARFTLMRNGIDQGTFRTWGQRHLVNLSPALAAGEVLAVSQRLCPGDPPSPEGTSTIEPCSALPAPVVALVQDGDTQITVLDAAPGARIQVYLDGVEVGDSAGSVIQLSQPVQHGDVLYVLQSVGTCVGSTVREVQVRCVAPPVVYDPAGLDLFPVGHDAYHGGNVTIDGSAYTVSGTVYYPADGDGQGQPFNTRLAGLGPVPIVFMAHGNHYVYHDPMDRDNESCSNPGDWIEIPNHEGYDYFQRQLARLGIIAVSVYSNETNCTSFSATNMRHRAELIIASIAHFQALAANPASLFAGRIDFSGVGLLGHSRGGEAVVVVPEIIGLPGVTIAAVISLAPTDAGASSGTPKGYAFMTILPAGDGDVVDNDGAKYYDKAEPASFKCQLYVHHTNHNFFNRQWPHDESLGPPVLSRYAHERILSAYGCAFFRAILLGHGTVGFLSGYLLPAGVATDQVHLSFEWAEAFTVDHHEDGNGIGTNSLGQSTQQLLTLTADEYVFAQFGAPTFNPTFFGNTIGMVAEAARATGTFRSELPGPRNVTSEEIWVRTAEVYNGSGVPAGATGFELGLEDQSGSISWVDSGGLPRPYDRRADDLAILGMDRTKTMLKTLRFPSGCFAAAGRDFDVTRVRAIQLRLNRGDQRALAFDVVQIV